MKFRCPYCGNTFGPEPSTRCPSCNRAMLLPDRFQRKSHRERERMKENIRRDAEHVRAGLFVPDTRFARQPAVVGMFLLALIVLGGVLIRQTGPDRRTENQTGRVLAAQRNVDTLRVALDRFRRDCGRYPTEEEGLEALVWCRIPGWKRYIIWVGTDPWDRPYQYTRTNDLAVVFSCGPDGRAGSSDDIAAQDPTPEQINQDRLLGRVPITNGLEDEEDSGEPEETEEPPA